MSESRGEKSDNLKMIGYDFSEEQIVGPVMVTKNPCSHPGDIRLLKAVGEDHPGFN